jgi:hypothetical protein
MDRLNPMVVRMMGANINRDTVGNVSRAGIEIDEVESRGFGIIKRIHGRPARKISRTENGGQSSMWHDADGMGWWMLWGCHDDSLLGRNLALIVWGVQSPGRRDGSRTPLEIAKERLARGEITGQEFEQIRQALRSDCRRSRLRR